MKILKKVLIVICIISMLITPTSVFANKTHLLAINSKSNTSSQSKVSVTDRPILINGQVALFTNNYTDTPFLFLRNSKAIINLEFEDITYCEVSLIDGSNILSYKTINGSNSTQIEFDIPQTSQNYKIALKNYGGNKLIIKEFTVEAQNKYAAYIAPGQSYEKVVYIGDNSITFGSSVLLSSSPGNIIFQILDCDSNVMDEKRIHGRACFISGAPPKGNYILRVINGNTEDYMSIYDMYI